jgi:hypothetical protein
MIKGVIPINQIKLMNHRERREREREREFVFGRELSN